MAYLALYRKWRPQTFAEVVGQDHIAKTLATAVTQGRVAHAYLFSGPRGTGKTSMAKILAKALNCAQGPTTTPCGTCESCMAIAKGTSFDVFEIDAASNRGIDEIRALRDTVSSLPTMGQRKVYIIDEAHMLTKEAANALLKTLEEPPAHVLFILATTEPERLPMTIISRCQRYEFRRIGIDDIAARLAYVARESGMTLGDDAAKLIAFRADGGLRDALSLLDQCAGATNAPIDAARVTELLGLPSQAHLLHLATEVAKRDSGTVLRTFYDILQEGKEATSTLQELLRVYRDILIYQQAPDRPEWVAYETVKDEFKQLTEMLTPGQVGAITEALAVGLRQTDYLVSARMQAEMTLLRLCRLGGDQTSADWEARLTALENRERSIPQEVWLRLQRLESAVASGSLISTSGTPTQAPPATKVTKAPDIIPLPDDPDEQGVDPSLVMSAPPIPEESEPVRPVTELKVPAPSTTSRQMSPKQAMTKQTTPKQALKEAVAKQGPPTPSGGATDGTFFISPQLYQQVWKCVVNSLEEHRRLAELSCYGSAELLLIEGDRAVVAIGIPFLVATANQESYRQFAEPLLAKQIGRTVHIRAVASQSPEANDARARAAVLAKEEEVRPKVAVGEVDADGFRRLDINEAKKSDDPIIASILKNADVCDIYVKED